MARNSQVQRLKDIIFQDIKNSTPIIGDMLFTEFDKHIFRNKGTLRLKREGHSLLSKIYWTQKFALSGKKLTGKELITLKTSIPLPYYLTDQYLYLFSSKQSFILALHQGDVSKWLAKLARNN